MRYSHASTRALAKKFKSTNASPAPSRAGKKNSTLADFERVEEPAPEEPAAE